LSNAIDKSRDRARCLNVRWKDLEMRKLQGSPSRNT